MRHKKIGKKFGRKKGQKKAFQKSLLHNLIMKEKIITTDVRAKEVTRLLGPLMTLAKKQNLASYRELLKKLPRKSAEKLFKDLANRYPSKRSGFTRIIKLNRRLRDAAPQALVAFVDET